MKVAISNTPAIPSKKNNDQIQNIFILNLNKKMQSQRINFLEKS